MPKTRPAAPEMVTSGCPAGRRDTGSPAMGAWLLWNSKSRPHWKRISLVIRVPSTEFRRAVVQSSSTPSLPQLSTPRLTTAAVCTPAGESQRSRL